MSNSPDYTTLSHSITIRKDPSAASAAITQPAELECWFADKVQLDPQIGGAFSFSDPVLAGAEVLATITKLGSDELGFSRTFRDVPSETTWQATADPEGSRMKWEQTLTDNTNEFVYYTADDLSKVALYNLRSYLETGKPAIGPAAIGGGAVRLQVTVQAPADDVWASLTQPEEMDKFLSSGAEVDLKVGGNYAYGWSDADSQAGPSKILELEEGYRLKTDWAFTDEPKTQLEWLVEGGEGFTVVTLTHSGFGDYGKLSGYGSGWSAFMLALKAKVEGREMVV